MHDCAILNITALLSDKKSNLLMSMYCQLHVFYIFSFTFF